MEESVPDLRDPRVWKERDVYRPSLKGPPVGAGCCGSLEERHPTHAHFMDGKTKVFQKGQVVNQNQSAGVKLGKLQFLALTRLPPLSL